MNDQDKIEEAITQAVEFVHTCGTGLREFWMDGSHYYQRDDGAWEWEPMTEDNCP